MATELRKAVVSDLLYASQMRPPDTREFVERCIVGFVIPH